MCGISAFLLSGKDLKNNQEDWKCFDILIRSLKALQNRGYDSCGIIDGEFKCLVRTIKKSEMEDDVVDINIPDDSVEQLVLKRDSFPCNALIGMAHTRWATSGKKTINNAHPHVSSDGKVAVIHNGIIENYKSLKVELKKKGWVFSSETDTEIISNWIANRIEHQKALLFDIRHGEQLCSKFTESKLVNIELTCSDLEEIVLQSLRDANQSLEGTWAVTVIFKELPNSIFVARRGNPLLIGYNQSSENIMIASEIAGFVNMVDKYAILGENQVLHLKVGFKIDDILKQNSNLIFEDVSKEIIKLTPGDFPYFMAKEIYDQEDAVYGPCEWGKYQDYMLKDIPELKKLYSLKEKLLKTDGFDVLLVGCGTSYNSGLSSRWFFDEYPFRTVSCIVASEFTKHDLPKGLTENPKNVIAILISQSGETLDTYRALKILKETHIQTVALVNVENSLISRECDYSVNLHAGREVGVASTKAYVTQIVGLRLLSLYLKERNVAKIPDDLKMLSSHIKTVLKSCFPYSPCATKDEKHQFLCPKPFYNIINSLDSANHGFALSSGSLRATSYEASLKIKEVGRVFIQGYPTSSLKHGPFALIEEGIPILFALQEGEEEVLRRTNSAIEEVHLRGARIFLITDIQNYKNDKVHETIIVPFNKTFSSILTIIPFQILSYFLSGLRGLNCDRPVNLAKCVTTD